MGKGFDYDVAIEGLDAISDGLGHYCRLYNQVGLMHAKSWMPIPPLQLGCLIRGKATLLTLDGVQGVSSSNPATPTNKINGEDQE
jgi:hypothetical protein